MIPRARRAGAACRSHDHPRRLHEIHQLRSVWRRSVRSGWVRKARRPRRRRKRKSRSRTARTSRSAAAWRRTPAAATCSPTQGRPEIRAGHRRRSVEACRPRMEVKGKAADRGDGKVKIESTTGTSGGDKTKVKTEMKGDSPDMNYLGVKSVKMISDVLHVGSREAGPGPASHRDPIRRSIRPLDRGARSETSRRADLFRSVARAARAVVHLRRAAAEARRRARRSRAPASARPLRSSTARSTICWSRTSSSSCRRRPRTSRRSSISAAAPARRAPRGRRLRETPPRVLGIDRHPWAIGEAAATYRAFRTSRRPCVRATSRTSPFRRGPVDSRGVHDERAGGPERDALLARLVERAATAIAC